MCSACNKSGSFPRAPLAAGLPYRHIATSQSFSEVPHNIAHTRAFLGTMDETQLVTLSKHDVVGDLMYATSFGYFALNGVQDQI